MEESQILALITTCATFLLSCLLAALLTKRYNKNKKTAYLFWSMGLWVFALGVLLEVIFALGVYSLFLMSSYLFIVVLLVVLLALGSIQLINSRYARTAFHLFAVTSLLLTIYSIASSKIGNLVIGYVVSGMPPMPVIIASSIATFVSAIVIGLVAAISYLKTRKARLLSIMAGVVLVSIAGTLYIASFPELLYISEFVGILLLWIGFL